MSALAGLSVLTLDRFRGLAAAFAVLISLSVAERSKPRLAGAVRVAIDALLDDPNDAAIDLAGVAERDLVSTIIAMFELDHKSCLRQVLEDK